jgi:hypothetical protein
MTRVIYLQAPILNRWRNHFGQVLNVHEVNDIRQTEIYTAKPPVPEPRAFEDEMAFDKLTDASHQVLIKFQQN